MYSSVTFGVLIVLLFVLTVVGCAMLASHLRARRPRTEAHHGRPLLDPSDFADAAAKRRGNAAGSAGQPEGSAGDGGN